MSVGLKWSCGFFGHSGRGRIQGRATRLRARAPCPTAAAESWRNPGWLMSIGRLPTWAGILHRASSKRTSASKSPPRRCETPTENRPATSRREEIPVPLSKPAQLVRRRAESVNRALLCVPAQTRAPRTPVLRQRIETARTEQPRHRQRGIAGQRLFSEPASRGLPVTCACTHAHDSDKSGSSTLGPARVDRSRAPAAPRLRSALQR